MAVAEHPPESDHLEVARHALTPTTGLPDALDRLWEQYLDALDKYENAQKEIQQYMSRVSSRDALDFGSLLLIQLSGILLASSGELQ